MEPTTIVIDAEGDAPEQIPVKLVGETYKVTPPKTSLALKLAVRAKTAKDDPSLMMEAIDEWLVKAVGKSQSKAIHKRLDDSDDRLDFEHIVKLMEAVIETTSGNPTS